MTEIEYVATIEACKVLIWLKDLMEELDNERSQSAINLVKNPVYHDKIKYIDVQYFIRILLKDSVLSLVKIHISQNLADILTKVVTMEKLKTCSTSTGLLG